MSPIAATMITFADGGLFAYFTYDDMKNLFERQSHTTRKSPKA